MSNCEVVKLSQIKNALSLTLKLNKCQARFCKIKKTLRKKIKICTDDGDDDDDDDDDDDSFWGRADHRKASGPISS